MLAAAKSRERLAPEYAVPYIAKMPEDLPRAAQPEYLTETLRRCGVLGGNRVTDALVESSRATILSRIIRLRLSYDGPATDAPASLILKTGLPESADAPKNPGQFLRQRFLEAGAAGGSAPLPIRGWDPSLA